MPRVVPRAQHHLRTCQHAVIDVFYGPDEAFAVCLLVDELSAAEPTRVITARVGLSAPYQPGKLYRRELPPILRLLGKIPGTLETVVVDGYVWLDSEGRPGLGAKLYEALQRNTRVVGVAKSRFAGTAHAELVYRGSSQRPLYVTAAGVSAAEAAAWVRAMHGDHRMPTLLQLAHRLSKDAFAARRPEPCDASDTMLS